MSREIATFGNYKFSLYEMKYFINIWDTLLDCYNSVPEFANTQGYDLRAEFAKRSNMNLCMITVSEIINHDDCSGNPIESSKYVGFVAFYDKRKHTYRGLERVCHVWLAGVSDNHRGKGLAWRMLTEVVKHAIVKNYNMVTLKTYPSKQGMVRLMEKFVYNYNDPNGMMLSYEVSFREKRLQFEKSEEKPDEKPVDKSAENPEEKSNETALIYTMRLK